MRRNDILQHTEAEAAIRAAILAVERMPGDTRLTNAVLLLSQAQEQVADYVDGIEPNDSRTNLFGAAALSFDLNVWLDNARAENVDGRLRSRGLSEAITCVETGELWLSKIPISADIDTARPAYQQRVIDEKAELDKKAYALSQFIGLSPAFVSLDEAEQERLKEQNDIMWQYSEALGKRIAAF